MNLYIKNRKTDEIVKTVDVTGKNIHIVERTMLGMMINLNTDEYYVDDSETDALYLKEM